MAEEKGYWFSTENGTHIHAEEGESKESAMGKKFKSFGAKKQEQSKYGASWKEGTSLSNNELEVLNEISKMKKDGNYDKEKLKEKFNGITDEDIANMEKAYELDNQKKEPGLKTESRSMINEKQANDPDTLADKLDGKETEKQIDSLYNKSKEKDLSFERMLLNDIKGNPDKYNEFTLGNKQYKRNGNAFDMYEDGKHVWTGTYNSVASDVNKYYEDKE